MENIDTADYVGVSQTTFSDTYRDAIEQAKKENSGDIDGAEVRPPFYVVISEGGTIEFRSTVRILSVTEK